MFASRSNFPPHAGHSNHSTHPQSSAAEELQLVLIAWESQHNDPGFNPKPTIIRVAELMEMATEEFCKQDPDPLDDRHPAKTYPSCTLGHLLKVIFRYESFLNKLVMSYVMTRDNTELNIAAARLLLDLVPGLDSAVVFSDPDDLIPQIYRWAQNDSTDPQLRAYSFGLLAAALEVTSIAASLKAENSALIPVALRRLKTLFEQSEEEHNSAKRAHATETIENKTGESSKDQTSENLDSNDGPFAGMVNESFHVGERPSLAEVLKERNNARSIARTAEDSFSNSTVETEEGVPVNHRRLSSLRVSQPVMECSSLNNDESAVPAKKMKLERVPTHSSSAVSIASLSDGRSNSQWTQQQRWRLGEHKIYPITSNVEQRFIIQYLTPIGEYQDLLKETYENRSLDLVMRYLNGASKRDSRLIFDVLKYLAGLLVHRKLALDFVAAGGVDLLIKIERESLASVVVGTCLYYLAYNADAMERVCLLPEQTLNSIVRYALWLLEHSYESGRAGASMFFTHAFQFRPIIERFDEYDGPRRLLNYISTLTLLQEDIDTSLSDEHLFTSMQAIRNTCVAFKSYMMAHVYMKVEHLKRLHPSRFNGHSELVLPSSVHALPLNKGMNLDDESLRQCVWLLLHTLTLHSCWKPVDELRRLGAIRSFLFLVGAANTWGGNAKLEIIKMSLDVLWICSSMPRVQLDICETSIKVNKKKREAIGVVLEICEGEHVSDPELQFAALRLIINCVSAPFEKIGSRASNYAVSELSCPSIHSSDSRSFGRLFTSSNPVKIKKQKRAQHEATDVQEKLWLAVRRNNGIMILKKLLYAEKPITEADALRATACRALNGLARSESIRQILEVMPLISCNEICGLIREPILPDRRIDHSKFCEQARQLVEKITKKRVQEFPNDLTKDCNQERLWKLYIVGHTKVTFNDKELLQLIHQHLVQKRLFKSAEYLRFEADLSTTPASHVSARLSNIGPLPSYYNISFSNHGSAPVKRSLKLDVTSGSNSTITNWVTCPGSSQSESGRSISTTSTISLPTTSGKDEGFAVPAVSAAPMHMKSVHLNSECSSYCTDARSYASTLSSSSSCPPEFSNDRRKQYLAENSPKSDLKMNSPIKPHKNLDEIITDYFRNQHSMCNNPVSTCPPFSLLYPHRCPEPRRKRFSPRNLAQRSFNRAILPTTWYRERFRSDNQFAFSRFRPVRSFTESEETFTSCSFSIDDEHILLGTYAGAVQWFNIHTGIEESNTECHHSSLTSIEQSKDGSLLLTSSAFVKPLSSLWRIGETQEHMINFPDEHHVEFSKSAQDRIIGTQGAKASIYDTETGQAVVRLYDENLVNNYLRNKATFDPRDQLVLNDGILWDPRVGPKPIHKFDKMNVANSGIFHPHGIEVIINSEVWDVRNFKLLCCVNALDQCRVTCTGSGHVLYGALYVDPEESVDRFRQTYGSSFRTFDSSDYKVISTIDAKRPLFDLCADHGDQFMAVIEAHSSIDELMQENICRLYEVGKRKEADDLDDEQEVAEDNDDDDDMESSSDIESSMDDDSLSDTSSENNTSNSDESSNNDTDENNEEHSSSAAEEHSSNDETQRSGNDTVSSDNLVLRIGNNDAFDIVLHGVDSLNRGRLDRRDIRILRQLNEDSGSDTEMDTTYNPDEDAASSEAHPGSSSIVLNPTLRRLRRREEAERQ